MTKPHFTEGSWQTIYQHPLTWEDSEGIARLVKCVHDHTRFDCLGLVVEEWLVQFENKDGMWPRIIAEDAE